MKKLLTTLFLLPGLAYGQAAPDWSPYPSVGERYPYAQAQDNDGLFLQAALIGYGFPLLTVFEDIQTIGVDSVSAGLQRIRLRRYMGRHCFDDSSNLYGSGALFTENAPGDSAFPTFLGDSILYESATGRYRLANGIWFASGAGLGDTLYYAPMRRNPKGNWAIVDSLAIEMVDGVQDSVKYARCYVQVDTAVFTWYPSRVALSKRHAWIRVPRFSNQSVDGIRLRVRSTAHPDDAPQLTAGLILDVAVGDEVHSQGEGLGFNTYPTPTYSYRKRKILSVTQTSDTLSILVQDSLLSMIGAHQYFFATTAWQKYAYADYERFGDLPYTVRYDSLVSTWLASGTVCQDTMGIFWRARYAFGEPAGYERHYAHVPFTFQGIANAGNPDGGWDWPVYLKHLAVLKGRPIQIHPLLLSVPTKNQSYVRLSPNPAHAQVRIQTDSPIAALTAYTSDGRSINLPPPTGTNLDIRTLPPSLYVLHVHLQNGQQTQTRLVVQ